MEDIKDISIQINVDIECEEEITNEYLEELKEKAISVIQDEFSGISHISVDVDVW